MADVDMTRKAADKLTIKVHDHIIIGSSGLASFKALKLI
jgi:DNA repair protein RadC